MSNKILFFSNQGLSPLHLSIELEILSDLKTDTNNHITTVTCNSSLSGCYFNPTKNILGCALCESRTQKFHKQIDIDKKTFLKTITDAEIEVLPKFKNLEDLESLTYKDVNVGRGIASSLISLTRDFSIESEYHLPKIQALYKIAIESYNSLTASILENVPDQIYFFNGRFTSTHVLREICKLKGIPYATFEVASSGKYLLFDNALPHSIQEREKLMKEMWDSTDERIRHRKAIDFFKTKRLGTFKARFQHTKNQSKNKLPSNWDNSKKNIVFFNSSEDEMKTIPDWKHTYYKSQNDAITTICEHYANSSLFHFYLRVHPNLGTVENSQSREISDFDLHNLTIIGPHETIDSYALSSEADIVVSFGSTIGIETTYWGTASVMFGRSFYENLDATYNPRTYEELYGLLDEEQLTPKPKENCLKYGNYAADFGISRKYTEFKTINKTYFNGAELTKWSTYLPKYIFNYLKYIHNWISLSKIFLGRSVKISEVFKLYHQIKK